MGVRVKKEWHGVFDFMIIPSQFGTWKSPHWSSRDTGNEHSVFLLTSVTITAPAGEGKGKEALCYRNLGLQTESKIWGDRIQGRCSLLSLGSSWLPPSHRFLSTDSSNTNLQTGIQRKPNKLCTATGTVKGGGGPRNLDSPLP